MSSEADKLQEKALNFRELAKDTTDPMARLLIQDLIEEAERLERIERAKERQEDC